jgi:hypothetical protein
MVHGSSSHSTPIHILDDDSLLNLFDLYQPAIFDGDELENIRMTGGYGALNGGDTNSHTVA